MSKYVSYFRITDTEDQQAIVMVVKTNMRTIDGEQTRFMCLDSDDAEAVEYSYELTPLMKPVSLGSYEEFVSNSRFQPYHLALLEHQTQALGPLTAVRAIDILANNGGKPGEAEVQEAINQAIEFGDTRLATFKEQVEATIAALQGQQ